MWKDQRRINASHPGKQRTTLSQKRLTHGVRQKRVIPVSFVFGVSPLESRDLFAVHTSVKELHFAALAYRQWISASQLIPGLEG
jgi:hypothetical protein